MIKVPYDTINVLLEATEACNLRCKYCYHADDGYVPANMTGSIFKKVCELVFSRYKNIQFLWHGGEPLCAGLDFHKMVYEIQKSYRERYPQTKVTNAIQTNGTLIDEETARFLADNNFSVGVSFDGTDNELTRGKTERVLNGIRLLKNAGIKSIGGLTVISGMNIGHLDKDYALMKEMCLSTDYNSLVLTGGACHFPNVQLEFEEYCRNMIQFFDLWFYDISCNIVVNPFHSYVRDMLYNTASICWRTSCLGRWINVKPDGAVYPCSREYPKEYSFGMIQNVDSIDELFNSDGFIRLLEESIVRREKCEAACEWYPHCQGGCSCTALTESGITNNDGFSCRSFKILFSHCDMRIKEAMTQGADYIKNSINPMIAELLIEKL